MCTHFFHYLCKENQRYIMSKLRAILIWVILSPFLSCSVSGYFFRTVDVKNGLADNFVRDIVRDSYGYIWFSSINGLSRYDGYRFNNYMPQEFGGRNNDVTMVRETADKTLWMACSGELYTYVRAEDSWKKDGNDQLAALGMKGTMKVFYVDEKHNLWVATDAGLFHYDYSIKKLYDVVNYSKSPVSHIVSKNGTTVVVTADNKIYEVAENGNRLTFITQAPTLTYSRDSRVFLDSRMNLWFYDSHSLAGTQELYSLKTRQWQHLSELAQLGSAFVNAIAEDNEGNLWVGTDNAGIHVFAYQDKTFGLNKVMSMKAFKSRSSHVFCFYLDDNNTMWVGSAKLGAAFADLSNPTFNLVSTGDHEDVSALVQDRKGNLWIGFDGEGIVTKIAAGGETHYSALRGQLPSDIITSLLLRPDGSLLAGTYGGGIAKYNGSAFTPIYTDNPNLKYVKAMAVDTRENLWVATVDRGVVRITPQGKTVNFTTENSSLLSNGTLCLACDSLQGMMYIGTSMGVSVYDCNKEQFIQPEQLANLKGSYVSSLMVDHRSVLWIGCRDGLRVYTRSGALYHLTTENGMSHNAVRAMTMATDKITGVDGGSCVWVSTDNGLTCITIHLDENRKATYKCYPFLDSDGLQNVVFSNNAALTTADGTVLLGCFTGYLSVPQEGITIHYPRLMTQFTECRVNRKEVPLSQTNFTVHYNDPFSISVSAMVPALNQKIKYLYRFEDEEEWARAPGSTLYFASLRPGNHVLQVKAVLPDMTESEIAELPIKVLPPLWQSKPALLFYLLLLLGAVYLVYRALSYRQRREIAMKQMEINLKKYDMEEQKIRFFTNISHDLKTPLTLVVAPLEKIREASLPAPIRTELDVAWRNARQLYDLVLELLDFRRLDVGMEKLNLKHGDIVGFVRQTVQGFAYYVMRKQIKLQMQLPQESVEIDFDENKMRRIITNLLSNAYKYNIDNGSVTVTLTTTSDTTPSLVLSVADTGIGVNDKQHIFDRFIQETHGQEQEGSGLGLHIVKQYVDMMGGNIDVTDNKPRGTIFTVTLPITESAETMIEDITDADTSFLTETVAIEKASSKPIVLVVDDNEDARLFLQRSLDDEYHVLVAANGKEALDQLAKTDDVSIVICDVMMPVMDGITFFRKVKSDIRYSHIPVVLLTAKSNEENIVAGLEEGVADYITKPFSLAVLRLRIRKILEWTQNVHSQVATGIEIKPSEITVSSLDEELISSIISQIEANIQDTEYSVSQLSAAVGMTRGHLYKKLMAITGKSPVEFIRIIKMKRGKSLLDQGKTNISEVADMVGFSAKMFAHYFKMMYGSTPSEYLKKRK